MTMAKAFGRDIFVDQERSWSDESQSSRDAGFVVVLTINFANWQLVGVLLERPCLLPTEKPKLVPRGSRVTNLKQKEIE